MREARVKPKVLSKSKHTKGTLTAPGWTRQGLHGLVQCRHDRQLGWQGRHGRIATRLQERREQDQGAEAETGALNNEQDATYRITAASERF